jgi:hypothetical protein
VTGVWRKLHNEELRNLYCSPSINRIIKPRKLARMGEKRNVYRLLVGKPKGIDHYEDQDIGGWIALHWILQG